MAPIKHYGVIMKEYVKVQEHIAADPTALRACFEKCITNAELQPAKAARRRRLN
jgi:hypothetical protein